MNELRTDQLFEMVKNAPTELSRDQVSGIIQGLPNLPPGGSWFQNLNLNSIIMTTTTVTIIGSALLYFLNQSPQAELPGQEVQIAKTEVIVEDTSKNEVSSVPIPEPSKTTVQIKEESEPVAPESTTSSDVPKKEAVVVKELKASTPAPQFESDSPKESEEKLVSTLDKANPGVVKLSADKLRKLKREFLRFIEKDKLTTDKNGRNVLVYASSGIRVNDQPLDSNLVDRYVALMNKYGVEPGANRRVVTHTDYIMVGNFTNEGFKGQALGKNMDIKFIDDRIRKDGIFDPEGSKTIDDIPRPDLFPSGQDVNQVIKATPKSTGSLNLDSRTPSENLIGDKNSSSQKKDLLSPGKKTATKKVKSIELNGRTIKRLKRILYQNLVNDGLIDKRNVDVRMLIDPQAFDVNGEILSSKLRAKYALILKRYSVIQSKDHKILMSSDFIFVGKFMRERFSGTVQGNLDPETIKGGILEADLMSLSLFNNDDGTGSNKAVELNGKFNLNGNSNQSISKAVIDKATEEREIPEFHTLIAKGVAVVYISTGKHQRAKLVVRGMPIEDVTTQVRDGVLMVDTRGNPQGESIEVYVSSPNLKEIEVGGAAEIYSDHKITADDLKVSSTDVGAAFLNVNANNLMVTMSGGDLELKGETKYLDILYERGAERGTLDYWNLKVDIENGIADNDNALKKELQNLRVELVEQLSEDQLIRSKEEQITVTFTRTTLTVNGSEIVEEKMNEYRGLFAKYGILLQNERKIFTKAPFIILADRRNDGIFKFVGDGGGKKVNISIKKNWEEQEKAIFREN